MKEGRKERRKVSMNQRLAAYLSEWCLITLVAVGSIHPLWTLTSEVGIFRHACSSDTGVICAIVDGWK